jgi:hypothetical protein
MQRLFTVQETSKIIKRSIASVWRDIRAERLDAVYINGSTRITGASIDRVCTPKSARITGPSITLKSE